MASRAAKLDRLRQLKQARSGGRIIDDDEDENGPIYDEVDEATYRDHKRKQLMEDDFVVDDDGEGYVDTGVDEWADQSRPNYESDEEVPEKRKRKATKVAKSAEISNFFKPNSSMSRTVAPEKKEANIDDILNDFGGSEPKRRKKDISFKRSSPAPAPAQAKSSFFSMKKKKRTPVASVFDDDVEMDLGDEPEKDDTPPSEPLAEVEVIKPVPSSPVKVSSPPPEESDSDDDMVVAKPRAATTVVRPTMSTISSIKANVLQSSPVRANTETVKQQKVTQETVTSGDSFKMFWTDYAEADRSLLLFGKVLTAQGQEVSGIVQINGLCRELYFLPRDGFTAMDVYEEVVPKFQENYELPSLRAKVDTKKYAFEIPGVPQETEYLKMLFPFKTPTNFPLPPIDLEGKTFSKMFGSTSSLFEEFVLQRNIMGPCWLEIKGGDFKSLQNCSHCQVEVQVNSPNQLSTVSKGAPPAPALTLLSLAVQTRLDEKSNNQEIVAITLATYRNVPQDAAVDENLAPTEVVTLCRPIESQLINKDLDARAKKSNFSLRTFPNEKVMLNVFAALMKNTDPDVIIGHKLESVTMEVLVHRMHRHNIALWSALGRRNRKSWPQRFGQNQKNSQMVAREVFSGRLLCDISNELGRSLTLKCSSWELPEMWQVVCGKQYTPMEVNYANMTNPDYVMTVLKDVHSQALMSAVISFSIQILSLSKQLTNIAGNAWSKTLAGTRSGRNEFILLHEFRRNNYIVPDKGGAAIQQVQSARVEGEDEDPTTQTSNKKPKYQGGLVFEPERGLHDNYTLVMDFNSLYPSIIQEYNICFTTVNRDAYNRSHDEQKDMPSYPQQDQTMGVFPKLLHTLVSRRKEVKKLLKDPKNTPHQSTQFDIKQQALKLTANSMYGCLGFQQSRFYAKPLAMLVTNKGREILMDTRQLAESEGLKVVYGDTDSVMISSGRNSYPEAIKIGEEFKVKVNEKYKLLEIDIDNVFKRLLLHAKKKYAAMNVTYDKKLDAESYSVEVKGLDMRRREYCQLSKDVSMFILEKLLGDDSDRESMLQSIYDYLVTIGDDVRSNSIRLDKFRINKKLSKDPEKYNDAKNQPHVLVGLRLQKQGKVIKNGSVISYVITSPQADSASATDNERARAFQEIITNKDMGYTPDANYYLEKQILAPVQRLLDAIDGVDIVRVAESLGLDGNKYIHREAARQSEIVPMEANLSDNERFNRCSYFVVSCQCGHRFRFGGIQASVDYSVGYNGITCLKCSKPVSQATLTAQLEYSIRRHLAAYYAGWLRCNDSSCSHRTRQIGVYGRRCLGTVGCKGVMRFEYSDRDVYNQLLYFSSVFNVDKAKLGQLKKLDEIEPLPIGQLNALVEQNREQFSRINEVVEKYLNDCGRRYVNMASIFNFLEVAS